MSKPTPVAEELSVKKESKNIFWTYIKNNLSMYVIGALMVILTNGMQVLSTRNMGWILDFFTDKPLPEILSGYTKLDTFHLLFGIMFVSRILLTIGRFGWRMTLARQTHFASGMLRARVWDKVRYFKSHDLSSKWTKGVLMNASTSDVGSSRFIFGFTLVAVFDVLFLGILTLGAMFLINVPLTLMSLVVMLFLPIAVKKLSELEIKRYGVAQNTLSEFNDISSQVISTIKLQRLTQTGDYWEERLKKSAKDYQNKRYDLLKTSLRYIPVMGSSSLTSYGVLFFMGIGAVVNGSLSIGDFIAMQGLIFLLQDPLMELGFIISEMKKGFTSLERLTEIYTTDMDTSLLKEGREVSETEELMNIRNLNFSYDNGPGLITDLSFVLKKGDRLGITGQIGTGKSTLVKILSGLIRGYEGEVFLAGKPFDFYGHDNLRKYIGQVHQKPFLFAESIKSNIAMDEDLSNDEIWRILKVAGLSKDVKLFPYGIETPLGEWGINLSGGQKQRLTIARALSRKPRLLFLDDCLSAVDTVTEEEILKNLDQELSETTLVWVAHRKSTLKYCNKILDFDQDQKVQVSDV
ncbi:MAG: ABC transporter ATP-binding protein [Bacteriovoracaceae bacterium]|nr:ABC transporter ATP-binding protein [Bacteriovoracaceae bacterium]